jgi:imidazolonepropionase-like amidohydrolase
MMPEGRIPSASDGQHIWLCVGSLIDGVSPTPLRDAHVVYDATSILYVGPPESPPPPDLCGPGQSQPNVVLRDYTLLPGLIEAHCHLFLEGGELDPGRRGAMLRQSPETCLSAARDRLDRLVRLGIVAVRDAGDRLGVGLALGALSRSGHGPVMPAIESPGAGINHRGRYGGFMAEPVEDYPSPRDCVRSRVRDGADRIKLIATGVVDLRTGRMSGEPQMTADEVSTFVEAAKEFGKLTFAHASGAEGISRVIDGGIGSVEHGFLMRPEDLPRMRDRQIAWTPTFAPLQKQLEHADRMEWDAGTVSQIRRVLDQHAAQLLRAHELGVPITAGSDAGAFGVPHGHGLLDELELMEAAGLPAAAVLIAATGNGSIYLGLRERCGQIKCGFPSRFILTRHSPLDRIGNLKRQKHVVFDGIAYPSATPIDMAGM